ncbi:MAG: response regulator, partial [Rhodospirillales bacterium]|nr:response regulator [Rhodospirillales bacterium]
MSYKVLLIDDDQNLLSGLRRQFRKQFDLLTANGGEEGIKILKEKGPIAVVVSDMQMPSMNGLQTLKAFRKNSPETVRIMLTGNADQQTATDAVNEGEIFKFFNKPCSPETLSAGINSAIKQYQLITAERELLEQTLAGTVKFLVDLLAFSKPVAFARSTRIREWIKAVLPNLELEAPWKLDFAAMLLPLCDMIIPTEIEQK